MEAIDRSHVNEYHRYKRKRMPIPVLPPKVPATYSTKLELTEKNTNFLYAGQTTSIISNDIYECSEVPQPAPGSRCTLEAPHHTTPHSGRSSRPSPISVDTKGEENECTLPSAFAAAAASKMKENGTAIAISQSVNDAACGGVFYACKVSGHVDELGGGGGVRVCRSAYVRCHRQIDSSHGYASSRQDLLKGVQQSQQYQQQNLQYHQQQNLQQNQLQNLKHHHQQNLQHHQQQNLQQQHHQQNLQQNHQQQILQKYQQQQILQYCQQNLQQNQILQQLHQQNLQHHRNQQHHLQQGTQKMTLLTSEPMEMNLEKISLQQPQLIGSELCKFRLHCDESEAKDIDHRFRYGLSSLEIYSKYSARRSDGSRSEIGWADSEQRFFHGASTAATFFARASEKLKLNSSPHRRKKRGSTSEDGASASVRCVGGFCNLLHRSPPAVPSALLRKLGQKEVAGIGKVKVILKVCGDAGAVSNPPEDGPIASILNVDKKKKQIALYEPATSNVASGDSPDERKPSISAPKMFAFDALFSDEDQQTEICANALTDVTHAVISGNDGCIFCFGNAQVGKTKTMIGSCDSPTSLGVIPCAISWLYKAVSEQKQKTGARFSIRVSAVEITAVSQQIRDLLTDYASDTEQSPGVYLKDDPILGSHLQNRSELRAPFAEKAAFYLDAAQSERTTGEESHFLYTLHVYQYNVANKGTVAGGRSRLYLIDLAGHDRTKSSGLSISNLGNVLLAIFNGQKHIPHRDHKITQVLKECLSSLTCHAAAIAHVSPLANHYHETLATVQFASRIHRIRRRKLKFVGVSNGINTTTDENGRLTSSSDFDPSSSEQSADTVIYVGPSEETDGEHPPVCIPSLNSVDNRGVLSKVLRDSDTDGFLRGSKSVPASPYKTAKVSDKPNLSPLVNAVGKKHHPKVSGFHSAHSSPVRTAKTQEEQWIDGPRISKSKVAEARNVHLMRKDGQKVLGKREMWVDGPLKRGSELAYGFMDSHKKSMIRKWVENQSLQLQTRLRSFEESKVSQPYKVLTVFKTCENDETEEGSRGQGSGQEEDDPEEPTCDRLVPYGRTEDPEPRQRFNGSSNLENCIELEPDCMDDDMEIEIIEVEEPEEPVPMQDCCLQVTEEDIALCMGELENPLPEVDQEEHPLRVLSQENLTIVSTFTDSMSVVNDLERFFPRTKKCLNENIRPQPNQVPPLSCNNLNLDKDKTRTQLSKLHELYENMFDLNSCFTKHLNGDAVRAVSRCQSMTLSELCNGAENNLRNNDFENSSIASEPAYINNAHNANDRLCENCKSSLTSIHNISPKHSYSPHQNDSILERLQSYRHMKNIMNLRHPDGASNPNLQEMEGSGKLKKGNKKAESASEDEDEESAVPQPLTSKLLTLTREGFDGGGLFKKSCDRPDFVHSYEKFSNGLTEMEQLHSHKGQYARANVKKLQTYQVELRHKK